MIRKYNIFKKLNEDVDNKYELYCDDYGSLGDYVEHLYSSTDDKERFIQILGKYLKTNTDIRISQSVNVMPEIDQRFLIRELERELKLISENIEISPGDELKNDIKDVTLSGKWGFNSFIKVITALNLRDITPDYKNCPDNFAIYYSFNEINKDKLIKIMDRFRSLDIAKNMLEESSDTIIGVYFGVRYDTRFYIEYGLLINDVRKVFGEFKFSKSQLNNLMNNKSKSISSFKEEIKKVSLNDLKLLMKVKNDLTNFSPGFYHKKTAPVIKDNILVQSYYGLGNWENGMMRHDEIDKIKQEFKNWILEQKWKKKIVLSIKADKFWVYFKIKIKK